MVVIDKLAGRRAIRFHMGNVKGQAKPRRLYQLEMTVTGSAPQAGLTQ